MTDVELEITDSLDRVFPIPVVVPDWDGVLHRAGRRHPTRKLPPRTRRVAGAATAIVVCGLLVAPAFGLGDRLLTLIRAESGHIVFECAGDAHAPKRLPRGRCTVSGVITDRGKFADDAPLGVNPHGRTFFGAKGTIEMDVYLERGHWEIASGSRAYRGLRGGGSQSPTGPCRSADPGCPIYFTMRGTVSG
jgi:hypothetical protein